MNKLFAEKLLISMGKGFNPDKYEIKPKVQSAKEAAQHLLGKKKVCILTGAGLSAASGIPTFRGDNGFWSKKYGTENDPTIILTQRYFGENPALNW